jgi:hypothetical protein
MSTLAISHMFTWDEDQGARAGLLLSIDIALAHIASRFSIYSGDIPSRSLYSVSNACANAIIFSVEIAITFLG